LFGVKGYSTEEDKYYYLLMRLRDEKKKINVVCHSFNVAQWPEKREL